MPIGDWESEVRRFIEGSYRRRDLPAAWRPAPKAVPARLVAGPRLRVRPCLPPRRPEYRGTHFHVLNRKWQAKIRVTIPDLGLRRRSMHLGYFASAAEAARAYDAAARAHHGRAARLNFPEEVSTCPCPCPCCSPRSEDGNFAQSSSPSSACSVPA